MAVTKKQAGARVVADDPKPADIAPATDFEASGAVIEPGAKKSVDMKHASVDDNPRKDTTADMNQIDFNEPSALTPPEEAVEKALKDGE
jgi:hypothetical protein